MAETLFTVTIRGWVGESTVLHVHYKINWLLDICIDKTHQKRTTQTQLERKGVDTATCDPYQKYARYAQIHIHSAYSKPT